MESVTLRVTRLHRLCALVVVPALFLSIVGCAGGGLDSGTSRAVTPAAVCAPAQAGLVGDLNGNGLPDVSDAIGILRIVVGLAAGDPLADCDADGSTGVSDAIMLLRCVVGLDDWPIGGGGQALSVLEGGREVFDAAKGTGSSDEQAVAALVDWLGAQPEVAWAAVTADPTIVEFEYVDGTPGMFFTSPAWSESQFEDTSAQWRDTPACPRVATAPQPALKTAVILNAFPVYFDRTPSRVGEMLSGIGYAVTTLSDEEVTLDAFRQLGQYGVIFFAGHGGFNANGLVGLLTGEVVTSENYSRYEDLRKTGKVGVGSYSSQFGLDKRPRYIVRPSFFVGVPLCVNSVFYAHACHSLDNGSMSDALLGQGLGAYCGRPGNMQPYLDGGVATRFFDEMCVGATVQQAAQWDTDHRADYRGNGGIVITAAATAYPRLELVVQDGISDGVQYNDLLIAFRDPSLPEGLPADTRVTIGTHTTHPSECYQDGGSNDDGWFYFAVPLPAYGSAGDSGEVVVNLHGARYCGFIQKWTADYSYTYYGEGTQKLLAAGALTCRTELGGSADGVEWHIGSVVFSGYYYADMSNVRPFPIDGALQGEGEYSYPSHQLYGITDTAKWVGRHDYELPVSGSGDEVLAFPQFSFNWDSTYSLGGNVTMDFQPLYGLPEVTTAGTAFPLQETTTTYGYKDPTTRYSNILWASDGSGLGWWQRWFTTYGGSNVENETTQPTIQLSDLSVSAWSCKHYRKDGDGSRGHLICEFSLSGLAPAHPLPGWLVDDLADDAAAATHATRHR